MYTGFFPMTHNIIRSKRVMFVLVVLVQILLAWGSCLRQVGLSVAWQRGCIRHSLACVALGVSNPLKYVIKIIYNAVYQDCVVNGLAIGLALVASSYGCHPLIALAVEFATASVVRTAVNFCTQQNVDTEVLNDCRGFVVGNIVATMQLFPFAGAVTCIIAFTLEAFVLKEKEKGYQTKDAIFRVLGLKKTTTEELVEEGTSVVARTFFLHF